MWTYPQYVLYMSFMTDIIIPAQVAEFALSPRPQRKTLLKDNPGNVRLFFHITGL